MQLIKQEFSKYHISALSPSSLEMQTTWYCQPGTSAMSESVDTQHLQEEYLNGCHGLSYLQELEVL